MTLDGRIRELIAVGASITANCQPCLEYHAGKALENGADAEDVNEAIEVGKLVRRGAAAKMDQFAPTVARRTPCASAAQDAECGGCS